MGRKSNAQKAAEAAETPPPEYSEALAAKICAVVATGKSLAQACAKVGQGVTEDCVYGWMFRSPEFVVAFREAKRAAMFKYLEDTIDIADDDSGDTMEAMTKDGVKFDAPNPTAVKRHELKIKTRQWVMQNMNREVFAEPARGQGGGGDGDGNFIIVIENGHDD